ncbi:glycosyltransferase family 2 protein [Infirmifilum lucidum]|uniref:Glycosyltransferase family 2 protein n=1 Tax=Infirmifilum lucidum TaxID=2776706 RepID=A0A7L9FHS3_9CREN|nr:glycosyltransferase family 2 protein [Infirmifilum lucidum]QOJ78454.1 glycosyltransferase family 2 protein [Infirmifilum lucidum]
MPSTGRLRNALADFQELVSVSVVIPSYRGGEKLVRLVRALAESSYPRLEIIVVVDEPSEEVVSGLMGIKGVHVIANGKRLGKVNALNTALRFSRGDIVIFLDDDVEIRDPLFVEKVVKGISGCDIGDIKKVVIGGGILGRMVYIEYVAANFASKLMARLAGRTLAMNGAAFVMTRKALEEVGFFKPVISEDFDLAIRSFLRGHKFTYIDSTEVYNYAPESWSKWYRQRKRWAVGLADWLQRYYMEGLKALVKIPHAVVPALLLLLPSLVTTVTPFLLHNHTVMKALYLTLLSMSSLTAQFVPFTTIISINLQLVYTVPVLASLLVFSAWHCLASKYVGVKSYAYLYPLYLFVYQPLWFTILLAGFIRVLAMGRRNVEDWVV